MKKFDIDDYVQTPQGKGMIAGYDGSEGKYIVSLMNSVTSPEFSSPCSSVIVSAFDIKMVVPATWERDLFDGEVCVRPAGSKQKMIKIDDMTSEPINSPSGYPHRYYAFVEDTYGILDTSSEKAQAADEFMKQMEKFMRKMESKE